MNAAIEMHDSECLAIELNGWGDGFVLLDAYVHRTDGEPGISPGDGGVQRIRIKVEGMTIEGEVGALPAYVYEGSLVVGADTQDNMIPFPVVYTEPVRLSMMLGDDARVVVASGKGLSIEPESEFRFVERVDFSSRKG
jgi:hypothetical protein